MSDPVIYRLGNYELLEQIGDGGEGRVFKAVCIADGVAGVSRGELVALKRLRLTGAENESTLFQRQAEILRNLNHPNIVRYKESFVWRDEDHGEETYCIVTEFLEGEMLKSLLQKHPTGLPWEQACDILRQILEAIQHVIRTGRGVIHRDLKPSNIFITRDGGVKLIDFGIARHGDGSVTTTTTAGIKGSFDYMAPDFVRLPDNFNGDEQSEIFSFGVCCYEVLTGQLPFPPLSGNTLINYVSRWHSPETLKVDFSRPVFRVLSHAATTIRKCLELDRSARFPTVDVVIAEFSRITRRKLQHGTTVYEYLDFLGRGGFGEVYRARRKLDGYEVAIKRLLLVQQAKRFIREAALLQNASHPNLVKYVDFIEVQTGDNDSQFFLILEYLPGMPGADLKQRIKASENGLDVAEVLRLFMSYLECLEHLHQRDIVHRDIKPGNLYAPFNDPGNGKIFDLGIALDLEGTRTRGQVPGSLDYMPPEFAKQGNERGSPQSDLYSLGISLHLALTKSLPFPRLPEKEPQAWLAYYERMENPPVCPFDHPVFREFPELVDLLQRAIAPDPKRRPASAAQIRHELSRILNRVDLKRLVDAFRQRLPAQTTDDTIAALNQMLAEAMTARARVWPGLNAEDIGKMFTALWEETRQRTVTYLHHGPGEAAVRTLLERPLDEFASTYPHLKTLCMRELQALRKTVRHEIAAKQTATHHVDHEAQTTDHEAVTADPYADEGETIAQPLADLERLQKELLDAERRAQVAKDSEAQQVRAEAERQAAAAKKTAIRQRRRSIAITTAVVVLALGIGVGALYGWFAMKAKTLARAVTAADQLTRTPIEAFPLGEWRAQLKQATINLLANDSNVEQWRMITNTLEVIGQRLPTNLSNAFATAIGGTNVTLAKALLDKWKEIQADGIAVDRLSDGGMEEWMQAELYPLCFPKVTLTCDPPGAEILLHGVSLGSKPVETNLEVGVEYAFTVQHPAHRRLGELRQKLRLPLAGAPTNVVFRIPHGSLRLMSQPVGVEVIMNNESLGITPLTATFWPTGAVSLVLAKGQVNEPVVLTIPDSDDLVTTTVVLQAAQQLVSDQLRKLITEIQRIQNEFGGAMLLTPEMCKSDVAQRARQIGNLLKDPQYSEQSQHPDVVTAQREFWKAIALETSKAFQRKSEWPFLAIARGALREELRLAPHLTWLAAVANWHLDTLLPAPRTDELRVSENQPQNSFLQKLPAPNRATSAGLSALPQVLSIRIGTAGIASLILVPDGAGLIGPKAWSLKSPFYMAATETTLAAMRGFREGAKQATLRDPRCSKWFLSPSSGRDLRGPPTASYEEASLNEVLSFCNWLSYTHRLELVYVLEKGQWTWDRSKFGYRLPTVEEWEYAARYGFDYNSNGKERTWQTILGSLKKQLEMSRPPEMEDRKLIQFYEPESRLTDAPETALYPLGLRDMCGNVAELCHVDQPGDNQVDLNLCGGHYHNSVEKDVMPWSQKTFDKIGVPVGFRIVLPMPVEDFSQ